MRTILQISEGRKWLPKTGGGQLPLILSCQIAIELLLIMCSYFFGLTTLGQKYFFFVAISENFRHYCTEDERSMTTFYYCSVNHQSGLQSNIFSKKSYRFFNTLKCAANYVFSFEVYDCFIGQKILKL